jgi:hypothetical protein
MLSFPVCTLERGRGAFGVTKSLAISADRRMNEDAGALNAIYLWTSQMSRGMFFAMAKGAILSADKSEVLQGTLDMMILKTLHALGPLHGFGIARRIEQVSEDVLKLNEGTVYTSLLRLQQQGWIESRMGNIGEQSQGQVLLDHQARTNTTCGRNGKLGADLWR